ncbi:MAG: hypothetical protein V1757_01370 [Actinomycetota bacterium]
MDRRTVLAAAGALVLTVVGGMSALAVAFPRSPAEATTTSAATTASTVVVTEYYDEAGNPIVPSDAVTRAAQETVIVPVQGQPDEFVVVHGSGNPVRSGGTTAAATTTSAAPTTTVSTTTSGGWTDDDGEYEGSDDPYEGGDDDDPYEGGDEEEHGDD